MADFFRSGKSDFVCFEVFTDFTEHKPEVINSRIRAVDAEALMRGEHVRLKLVVDDFDRFLGVVTLDELNGEEILKKVAQGFHRGDILVSELMNPRSSLRSLNYKDLQGAFVGDIVRALQSAGQDHCLVVDLPSQRALQSAGQDHCLVVDLPSQRVRGVISASEIVRRVGLPLNARKAPSFVDIFTAIHPSAQM